MTLTEFLLARIAEEESLARDVHETADYSPHEGDSIPWVSEAWDPMMIAGHRHQSTMLYIPALRLLAECEAKRRIIGAHDLVSNPKNPRSDGTYWQSCNCLDGVDFEREGCPTTLALALPYANHPDYRPEWMIGA